MFGEKANVVVGVMVDFVMGISTSSLGHSQISPIYPSQQKATLHID